MADGTPTVVDLFAGLGGFSTGAKMAGARVAWAGNHWPLAVEWHRRHHPDTAHVCQDLHQFDFHQLPDHDIGLASPACQGHTPARGKERPHHDATRSTAWAVVSAAEAKRPAAVIVENVPAFQQWVLYPAWKAAMEALGYAIAPHLIDAADHGVPQHRIRLFLVCTRSRAPIQLQLPRQPHRPIRPAIRWDVYNWSPVDRPGRSPATLARIRAGRAAHGDRFLAPYYGSGSGETGRSLDRPLGTVTTRDRWALIDGDRMRMLQPDEYRVAMGFPICELPGTRSEAIHLLGNAVCPPVARDIIGALVRANMGGGS